MIWRALALALPVAAALWMPGAALATAPPWTPTVDVDVSDVRCPGSHAVVRLSAQDGSGQTGFSVMKDDQQLAGGVLSGGNSRSVRVKVPPGQTIRIRVEIAGQGAQSYSLRSDCHGRWGSGSARCGGNGGHCAGGAKHWWNRSNWFGKGGGKRRNRLPFTGPPADLWGKVATAGGLVVVGAILWWYAWIWPRRDYPRARSLTLR